MIGTADTFSDQLFRQRPIVGILRNIDPGAYPELLSRYHGAGFTTIEITMNTTDASKIIREARDHWTSRLNIGAGTVCNVDELKSAIDAGAQFIVTPVLNIEVIDACVKAGMPVFPGTFSPTEIYKAWQAGATLVKVFPASAHGSQFIKEMQGPFPQIGLMAVGGVGAENFRSFFDAGAAAVGMGSKLFPPKIIESRNWDMLSAHFNQFN